ncbi:hypothetical protein [Flavobacterium sp.]|uniref:hypothetical protein n=1 Tax=Flavobacterium sp. TaxID=239 RepID=UPI004034855E
MKTKKTEKAQQQEVRYIPESINTILEGLYYKRKDDLYCLLDMIYRKQLYYKKSKLAQAYGFVNINYKTFRQLISKTDNITKGLAFLEENGLVIINHHYLNSDTNSFSKSYRIPSDLLSKKMEVVITDKTINKNISNVRKGMRKEKVKDLAEQQMSFFKSFKIDKQNAQLAIREKTVDEIKKLTKELGLEYSNEVIDNLIDSKGNFAMFRGMILNKEGGKAFFSIMHRMMLSQLHVNSIADGFLFFKKSATNGRLFTNLTSLPSYLRKFIISDENLINIDIKTSQPFFMYTALIGKKGINKDELTEYSKMVTQGLLYETFAERYRTLTGTKPLADAKDEREFAKKQIFKIFFSRVASFAKEKSVFRSIFPTIMGYIDDTNRVENNTLSLQMQNMESDFITKTIMNKCKDENIIPLTIHDSLIVGETTAPRVLQILTETFKDVFGVCPSFHYIYLLEGREEDVEDDNESWFISEDDYDDNNEIFETIYLDDRKTA